MDAGWTNRALGLIFGQKCALCGMMGSRAICGLCLAELPRRTLNTRLFPKSAGVRGCASIFHFEGRAAQAVRRLKYERATALTDPLAGLMRAGWQEHGLTDFDAIVPIPIHWRRRTVRGFNQAELLCRALPAGSVRPDLMQRIRATRPQVELSGAERLQSLTGAFAASPECKGKRVLLVDDVCTSGGTLIAASQALLEAGAKEVRGLTLCGEAPQPEGQASGESSP